MITAEKFVHLVEENFAFLVGDFGYAQCPCSRDFLVRYQTSIAYVEILFDPFRSHEVGILVGPQEENAPSYELREVLRAFGGPESDVESIDAVQTCEAEVMNRVLSKSAEQLLVYGGQILLGDSAAFAQLSASRSRAAATYTAAVRMKQMAEHVEAAWQRRDYCEVVRLLGPYRNQLEQRLLRRLQFAETRQ